jgi:2'-5' RNA ligase
MRTFIALVLPDSFKAELWDSLDEIKANHPGFRWTKDDNLHFTLAFLGEVEKPGIPVLIDAVKSACEGIKAIHISGGKLLTLPKRRPANVLALSLAQGEAEIAALANGIEENLEKAALSGAYSFRPRERRPFTAHLTIARKGRTDIKRGTFTPYGVRLSIKLNPQERSALFPAEAVLDKVVVFKSELRSSRPVYTPLRVVCI